MAREQILDLLQENKGKWFTSSELRGMLGISGGAIAINLKKLRRTSEVRFKEVWCKDKHYRVMYCYGNGDPCFRTEEQLKNMSKGRGIKQ